jgi:hypothetical protein
MTVQGASSSRKLVSRAAAILAALDFTDDDPREAKWRTSEQLAQDLELFAGEELDRLDWALREHEKRSQKRIRNGDEVEALIRRAKYPDRTTALPLWGSALPERHGQPWGKRYKRYDRRDPISEELAVPKNAPHVFLSHTHLDADLSLKVARALAAMGIGAWRFETHIEQRGPIAGCVRRALLESSCCLGLVTCYSIASLWVLTELHTSLEAGVPLALVLNAEDTELLGLFGSVRFQQPDGSFDLSVEYDQKAVQRLRRRYRQKETETRSKRYGTQVRDFLATLPSYLGEVPGEGAKRIWRPALAYPHPPAKWPGHLELAPLGKLRGRLRARAKPNKRRRRR